MRFVGGTIVGVSGTRTMREAIRARVGLAGIFVSERVSSDIYADVSNVLPQEVPRRGILHKDFQF